MSITADQLVVAVSSRALFDLEKEHQLFEKEGYEAFKDYQPASRQKITQSPETK